MWFQKHSPRLWLATSMMRYSSDIRVPFPVRHIRSLLIEIMRKALSKTMTLRALRCTSNVLIPKNCLTVAWCQSCFHVCVGENDTTLNISGALFTFKPSRLLTHLTARHAEVFVSFAPLSAWGPSKLSLRLSFSGPEGLRFGVKSRVVEES